MDGGRSCETWSWLSRGQLALVHAGKSVPSVGGELGGEERMEGLDDLLLDRTIFSHEKECLANRCGALTVMLLFVVCGGLIFELLRVIFGASRGWFS